MTELTAKRGEKHFSLIPYLLHYKWHYLFGLIVLLLVDLASLYIPQFSGEIVDGLAEGQLTVAGPLLAKIFAA